MSNEWSWAALQALHYRIDEELQAPLEIKAPHLSLEEQAARRAYLDAISEVSHIEMHGGDIRAALADLAASWQSNIEEIAELAESGKRNEQYGWRTADQYALEQWAISHRGSDMPKFSFSAGSISHGYHGSEHVSYAPSPVPEGVLASKKSADGFVEEMSRYCRAGLEAAQRVLVLLDEMK